MVKCEWCDVTNTLASISKMFLGYQLCQLVKNGHYRDQLHPHHEDLMSNPGF